MLNPYWTWAAQFMPPWLAPNVITLLGILAIYINIACVLIYIPDLVGPGPLWLYFSFAAGLFFYQTMDNIDGKQARRTGSSSPLGELFDHGIDSLNCCLGGLVQSACMGMGSSRETAFISFITCVAMFLSTWETYHTHTLYLGYLNGPTEGILIAIGFMLASGIFGLEVWTVKLADLIPISLYVFGPDFNLKDFWVLSAFLGVMVGHLPVCLYNVYRHKKKQGTNDFLESLPQLLPIVFLTAAVTSWLTSPYSSVLADNHMVLFALTMSLVFARVTTSIILAHLTRQPFPYWSLPMYPLFVAAVLFRIFDLPAWFELYYLWGYFLFCFVYIGVYSYKVINALCAFLDINCFTIKKKPEQINKKNQ